MSSTAKPAGDDASVLVAERDELVAELSACRTRQAESERHCRQRVAALQDELARVHAQLTKEKA